MFNLGLSPIIAISGPGAFSAPPDSITIFALADFPLLFRERGSETQARVLQAARQAGVKLEAKIIAEGREAVRDLVAEGFGIGFVAESENGSDIRLSRIRLKGSAHQCRKRWPICQHDVMCRSFAVSCARLPNPIFET